MNDGIPSPQGDRTQLQQIIAGLQQGVLIIDPDQTIAWSNEAVLEMHGVKSLSELGRTVSEYRKRFVVRHRDEHKLPPGADPMGQVLAGKAFTEVVVEVMRPGENRHRVQYIRSLVLTDPQGRPDCLVLIFEDETERFDAEERFERAFGANPAPALIVRLSDCRYLKVNQGFMELTGFNEAALVGRSMHEYDVLDGATKRGLAVERLHAGHTIPQMEACLRVEGGSQKTVILAGQPIEINDEACMLFTFADLHPRKLAEDALKQSEQRFAVAFRMAPVPMAMIALSDFRVADVNDAFTAATGWHREEVVGRTEPELGLWGSKASRDALVGQVKKIGQVRSAEVQIEIKNGHAYDYLLSAETVTINDEQCVLTVMLNITERKRTEAELLAAIEAVMQDTSWFSQKIVEKLATLTASGRGKTGGPLVADVTPRGRDVLALIAQGLGDQDIGSKLGMSRNTVKNHVSAIYKITGVRRRSELVVWARERGLSAAIKAPQKQRATRPRKIRPVE